MVKIITRSGLAAIALIAFALIFSPIPAAAQSGGIKGTVRANSGANIPNASVSARQNGRDIKTVRADAKGNFAIENLGAGNYNILFDANGYASGVLYNVEVKSGKVRDLGDRLILFPDQGSQVIIKGSVFFKEGTSVTGAKVEIERIDGERPRKIASAMTNISGEFTFRQQPGDAKFRITAKYKGVSASKEVTVSSAAIYRLAITLDVSRK